MLAMAPAGVIGGRAFVSTRFSWISKSTDPDAETGTSTPMAPAPPGAFKVTSVFESI
jgi:hypothetical protein